MESNKWLHTSKHVCQQMSAVLISATSVEFLQKKAAGTSSPLTTGRNPEQVRGHMEVLGLMPGGWMRRRQPSLTRERCALHVHNQPSTAHLNSANSSSLRSHLVPTRWSLEAPRCLYICGGGLFTGCRADAKVFSFTFSFNDRRGWLQLDCFRGSVRVSAPSGQTAEKKHFLHTHCCL